jgi:hypothetical protein
MASAHIGNISGARWADIDTHVWTWPVPLHTTPSPGGLVDNDAKGERASVVPRIEWVRLLAERRVDAVGYDAEAPVFAGPRGGSLQRSCATQRVETRSLPSSATNTCVGTSCGMPPCFVGLRVLHAAYWLITCGRWRPDNEPAS